MPPPYEPMPGWTTPTTRMLTDLEAHPVRGGMDTNTGTTWFGGKTCSALAVVGSHVLAG